MCCKRTLTYFSGVLLIGNETVPKIIINDTISLFLLTAISILVISNHNSFRVLFDKMLPYILFENIFMF